MKRKTAIRIDEDACDGCGLCIPVCAEGALKLVYGKARLVSEAHCDGLGACIGQCPRGAIHAEEVEMECPAGQLWSPPVNDQSLPEQLSSRNWPVQLRLLSPEAPHLKGADLLVVADCVPFSYPGFHDELLRGRVPVVTCPKFDDVGEQVSRLARIVSAASPRSVTVAHMNVPCCLGLEYCVRRALEEAGADLPVRRVTVEVYRA